VELTERQQYIVRRVRNDVVWRLSKENHERALTMLNNIINDLLTFKTTLINKKGGNGETHTRAIGQSAESVRTDNLPT